MKNRYSNNPGRRRLAILVGGIIFVVIVIVTIQGIRFKNRMSEMFRLNRELQERNYYMAEFEYRLLGIGYLLDKGHPIQAFKLFNQYYQELKTRRNLVKIPSFDSRDAELAFYIDLQNPKTGAFFSDAYPMVVYQGPTENVLNHIDQLADSLGKTVRLKYRLSYLDQINTPEKVISFLNDVSTVGWIASKMPQTSFHLARDILSLARRFQPDSPLVEDQLIQKYGLYSFSPEWKKTTLSWFYNAQDRETGLWGPKSKSGKLLKKDLNNTASILKAFKDSQGRDIYPEFPLKYGDKLLTSALAVLDEPPPADDDLEWSHEWNLKTLKSLMLVTRYLWNDITRNQKKDVAGIIKRYVELNCARYYIPSEGAFAYYPDSDHATIDGLDRFVIFQEIGALSMDKRHHLWGAKEETIHKTLVMERSELTSEIFKSLTSEYDLNSFRFYSREPADMDLIKDAWAVFYPSVTAVPDAVPLTIGLKRFIARTDLGMGNWVSRAEVEERLSHIPTPDHIQVLKNIPEDIVNGANINQSQMVILGFDALQIPRFRLILK